MQKVRDLAKKMQQEFSGSLQDEAYWLWLARVASEHFGHQVSMREIPIGYHLHYGTRVHSIRTFLLELQPGRFAVLGDKDGHWHIAGITSQASWIHKEDWDVYRARWTGRPLETPTRVDLDAIQNHRAKLKMAA